MNEEQASTIFGEFVGRLSASQYVCEDSICLKQPLGYTAIAEDSDTFVLSIPR